MISRTTIGSSFGGVVRYQFEGRKQQPSDKQAEVLVAIGVRSDSAVHMTTDFNRRRQLNPNLKQAVWHTSLSFNPDDADKLDSEKMLAIAEGYVQKMGLDQTQYAIIRHHDQPDNQHLHIIANRVGNDGKTIKDGQNFYRSKKVLKELIQEYGLTPPQGLRPEKQHLEQLQGVELSKHQVKEALHKALATATDGKMLHELLEPQGITFRTFNNKEGKAVGISFEKAGHIFKGSALHRSYSIAGIGQRMLANKAAQQQVPSGEITVPAPTATPTPSVPVLSAVEQKWQASHEAYAKELEQRNAEHRRYNQRLVEGREQLRHQQSGAGVAALWRTLDGCPPTLQHHLESQVQFLQEHQQRVEWVAQQREDLKDASGWMTTAGREAKAKLRILKQIEANPTFVSENYQDFAQEVAKAFRPAPLLDFKVIDYQQKEEPLEVLAAYAMRREQQQQVAQTDKHALQQKPTGPRLKH